MDGVIDVSELSKHKPLILGEAPTVAGARAFPPWQCKKVPESTRRLLQMAFNTKKLRFNRPIAEHLNKKLTDKFIKDNVLRDVQPENESGPGYQFDENLAAEIIDRELNQVMEFDNLSNAPIPRFYGRVVIMLGRTGDAFVKARSRAPRKWTCDLGISAEERRRNGFAKFVVFKIGGEATQCLTTFLWTYHPCTLYYSEKDLNNLNTKDIAKAKETIHILLNAGLEGKLVSYLFPDACSTEETKLTDRTLQVAA